MDLLGVDISQYNHIMVVDPYKCGHYYVGEDGKLHMERIEFSFQRFRTAQSLIDFIESCLKRKKKIFIRDEKPQIMYDPTSFETISCISMAFGSMDAEIEIFLETNDFDSNPSRYLLIR